ncbi:MAG: hypothetical protein ABFC54_10290 [Thermoguttaceae bacterium]
MWYALAAFVLLFLAAFPPVPTYIALPSLLLAGVVLSLWKIPPATRAVRSRGRGGNADSGIARGPARGSGGGVYADCPPYSDPRD